MGDILNERLTVDGDITSEKITADVDLDRPLKVDATDYARIERFVRDRINQVFAPVNSRMDELQHDIDEKIKLTDWMEA